MKIHTIPVGDLQANCYIIENLQDKQAILIDPGAEANKIINFIKPKNRSNTIFDEHFRFISKDNI